MNEVIEVVTWLELIWEVGLGGQAKRALTGPRQAPLSGPLQGSTGHVRTCDTGLKICACIEKQSHCGSIPLLPTIKALLRLEKRPVHRRMVHSGGPHGIRRRSQGERVAGENGSAEQVCGKEKERERNTRGITRHPTNDAEWVYHYVLFWPARGSNNRGGATPMLRRFSCHWRDSGRCFTGRTCGGGGG